MPDLLLELRSEEIPARMQRKAAGDLKKLVTDAMVDAGLTYEAAREYWTPRRLALDVRGVTSRSRDVREEIKGPPVKAPQQAVEGFLRKTGLASIDEAKIQADPKKGDFYVAVIEKPGRPAEEIIAAAMPGIIRSFPWPKSMRWGAASAPKGVVRHGVEGRGSESLRWVRPLQSIVCTFGPETEEPVVVDFEVDGIRSGNVTTGHRFHAPSPFTVRRFDDYVAKLEKAHVVLDAERRKRIILDEAKNLAFANGLNLVEDEGLLEEVSGLVEWPVVLLGGFEPEFLAIPAEVIRLTIKTNQKCFVTRPFSSPQRGEVAAQQPEGDGPIDANTPHPRPAAGPSPEGEGKLAPHFLLVANIEAADGGAEIARGNGKVVRARLSDAVHFWKTDQADLPDLATLQESAENFGLDLSKPLDQRMARLDRLGVTFHAKLGTQGERVQRIAALAGDIARQIAPQGGASTSPLWGGRREAPGGGLSPRANADDDTPTPTATDAGASALVDPPHKGEGEALAALARRAAVLAKADLQTEVVGEFPELQGAMGRKYAELQGEHPSVCIAIEEHYKPQGPSDAVPTDPVAIAVALADKLDTLVGFWAIDEKPTGSKDPYALRRAALGVIRILVENGVRLDLVRIVEFWYWIQCQGNLTLSGRAWNPNAAHFKKDGWAIRVLPDGRHIEQKFRIISTRSEIFWAQSLSIHRVPIDASLANIEHYLDDEANPRIVFPALRELVNDLLSFFHDRLKVYLRDQGARHDLIDAVLAAGAGAPTSTLWGGRTEGPGGGQPPQAATHESTPTPDPSPQGGGGDTPTPALRADPPHKGEGGAASNDDLLLVVRRVEALGKLLDTETGRNLLAGAKRAANILAAEEKKGTAIADVVDPALFETAEERALSNALDIAEGDAAKAIAAEDYESALTALAALRAPIDAFFEAVLVNAEDAQVRANRLALLARIRAATGQVADFSKIAG